MAVRKKRAKKAAKKSVKKTAKKSTLKRKKTSVKRKSSGKKKSSKTVRRTSKTASKRAAKFKLPLLSTLVKQPKKVLQSCRDRCEVAIEMKDAPGLFTQSGMRLPIGPVFKKQPKARKSRSRKSKGAQTLPAEIAHIFANPSVSL